MKSGVYPIETTHSGCQTYLTHPRKHRHTHFTLHTWDESHRLAWSPLRCRCNNSLCNTMKTPGCVPVTDAGTLTHMQWVLSHSLHSQTFYCWYKVRNLRSGLLRSPPPPPPHCSSAWVTKRSLSFISIASFGQRLSEELLGCLIMIQPRQRSEAGFAEKGGGGNPDKSENKNKARINKLNKWGKRNNKEWGNKGYNGETLKALVKWKFYNLCVHMHVNQQEHACLCVCRHFWL